MELEYIDHKEYDLTPNQVNEVIASTNWEEFETWWRSNDLPEGLQCIEMHSYPTLRGYVEALCDERKLEKDNVKLLQMALVVDSMIR
jgi:hypothetical protein